MQNPLKEKMLYFSVKKEISTTLPYIHSKSIQRNRG